MSKRKATSSPPKADNMEHLVSDRARQLLDPARKKDYWEVTETDIENFINECLSQSVSQGASLERVDEISRWLTYDQEISLPYARAMLGDYTTILKGNFKAKKLTQPSLQSPHLSKVIVKLHGLDVKLREKMQIAMEKMIAAKHKVEMSEVVESNGNVEEEIEQYLEPNSDIKIDCQRNFNNEKSKGSVICYCCGDTIYDSEEVQCDHFIPILQMLTCITPETCSNNLHFIHKKCNSRKKEYSLIHLWKNCGTNFYVNQPNEEKRKNAKDRIISILKTIEFNKPLDYHIHRLNVITYKRKILSLIAEMKLTFNTLLQANSLLEFSTHLGSKKNTNYEVDENEYNAA